MIVPASLIDVAPDPVGIGVVLAIVIIVIAAVLVLAAALVLILWYRKRSQRHEELLRPEDPSTQPTID